ncbi:hypothetical protein VNO78_10515 [Psophocarpus tetragonolobus]|uniref:Uncharacterized protein n=1 Tax=Psophocarpus tetragonolobus TaxID=3891 RepID=A0AAN9SKV2_PSOTE
MKMVRQQWAGFQDEIRIPVHLYDTDDEAIIEKGGPHTHLVTIGGPPREPSLQFTPRALVPSQRDPPPGRTKQHLMLSHARVPCSDNLTRPFYSWEGEQWSGPREE